MLFIVQEPNDERMRVLAWDTRAGLVSERFHFNGWRDMMAGCRYCDMSPDRRYCLFAVGSQLGDKNDLWLLDISRNRAAMLAPNAKLYRNTNSYGVDVWGAYWTPNRVILQLETQQYLSIDLGSLHVSPLRIGGAQ